MVPVTVIEIRLTERVNVEVILIVLDDYGAVMIIVVKGYDLPRWEKDFNLVICMGQKMLGEALEDFEHRQVVVLIDTTNVDCYISGSERAMKS